MNTELLHQDVAFGGHSQLGDHDLTYVTETFRPQSAEERARASAGLSPKPAYRLPDGTAMVSAVVDELANTADARTLHDRFAERWLQAGGEPGEVDKELKAWLEGLYSVCLRSPGPELILAKGEIAGAIKALLARPLPEADWWCQTLRHTVAAYETLVLPFASVDPERFGRATSRSLLVDAVRERWPHVFEEPGA
jgi:hypothetical protein